MSTPEDVDVCFNLWFNRAQPLMTIICTAGGETIVSKEKLNAIREQIKQAFTHGYAAGVSAEAARPLPD